MNKINFETIFAMASGAGLPKPPIMNSVAIPDAEEAFYGYMGYLCNRSGKQFENLPEYDEVIKWLTESGGKSLLLYGSCGRGKTMIANYVIPALIFAHTNKLFKCVDATYLAANIDEVLKYPLITVDDIGTEDITNTYGSKRFAVPELIDSVEKSGKLVILTSNLSKSQLSEKYGDRSVDRLRSLFQCVLFNGKSLR